MRSMEKQGLPSLHGSALFALVREANPAAAISALKPYEGQVYHTSLPGDTEQELHIILSKRI